MKIHVFVLAFGGLVGAVVAAQAQKIQDVKFPNAPPTELAPGPLEALQADFGKVVGDAFHDPDPVINAPAANAPDAPGPTLGRALRTSLQIPGAIFAAPYAAIDPDANAAPAPAAKPAVKHAHKARVHLHARGGGGYHRASPATTG